MKPIAQAAKRVLETLISGLAVGEARTINNTEGAFMAVHIERLNERQWAVSHSYVQNGDLMYDPEVVFWRGNDGEFYPVRYRQDGIGIDQELVAKGDDGQPKSWAPRAARDCASFCATWMRNIREQQGLSAKRAA